MQKNTTKLLLNNQKGTLLKKVKKKKEKKEYKKLKTMKKWRKAKNVISQEQKMQFDFLFVSDHSVAPSLA